MRASFVQSDCQNERGKKRFEHVVNLYVSILFVWVNLNRKTEQKEKPTKEDGELSERDKQLIDLISALPDDKLQQVLDFAKYLLEQK